MAKNWKNNTDDKAKYNAYLCSREWGVLKEAVHKRAGGKCERCQVLPIDAVHHLTYERKYKEKLEDLQANCRPCHDFTHAKSDFDPLANQLMIRWLKFQPATPTWLHAKWQEGFLREAFDFPTFVPVFQMWVTFQIVNEAAQLAIYQFLEYADKDGVTVGDVGITPVRSEISFLDTLPDDERSFWSWLSWGGPTQYPIGNKAAFEKCCELADKLREK